MVAEEIPPREKQEQLYKKTAGEHAAACPGSL